MVNSLYHGVLNSDFNYRIIQSNQLDKLRSILKLGYIITEDSPLVNECEYYFSNGKGWNNSDELCLSCHPLTKISKKYYERKEYSVQYTGYDLTMRSFALILNESILYDPNFISRSGGYDMKFGLEMILH